MRMEVGLPILGFLIALVPMDSDLKDLDAEPIVGQVDDALRDARLNLSQATGQVIKNGLALLGVSAPEVM